MLLSRLASRFVLWVARQTEARCSGLGTRARSGARCAERAGFLELLGIPRLGALRSERTTPVLWRVLSRGAGLLCLGSAALRCAQRRAAGLLGNGCPAALAAEGGAPSSRLFGGATAWLGGARASSYAPP